ncbi:tetratricopeptide repeat protein [Sorangium sp. So ce176]|uniref:tetratricopeptide repeat protein n=1 Tax=Sorangium sp. So ce176 TaxID=3133286 RepID=UPI003F62FB7D
MSQGAQEPLALLTADSEHNLDVLRRGLRRAASFAFYVVLAADAARAEVLRRLRAWSGSGGVPELRFFGEGADGAEEVARFLAVSDRIHPLAGAVIPDGVALVDTGGGAVVASLNMARDVLGKLIRGPLVLVIAADRAAELSGMAPDLFDVRAATLEIASVPGDPAPTFALHSAETRDRPQARSQAELQAEAARLRAFADDEIPAGSLADAWLRLGRAFFDAAELGEARAAAEEARRLAEGVGYTSGVGDALALEAQVLEQTGPAEAWEQALRRALVLRREAGDPAWTAVDLCRLGRAVAFLGRPEEAEALLREAIGLFEKLGEVRGRAVALGCIADLLERRGQLDEALRIRQQEELPVYERLGDAGILAVTLGKIADIYLARGQLDEALRIRQQEELPVHERLGDVRSRAVTLGKVADIYHAQGKLDEAQRLLEREVLPVHERTGAVRLRAVTLGQIAGVLRARGELDKALHLLEREVLPVLDRLGDIRSKLCCETNMAIIHLERHAPGDSEAAAELLRSAGRDAERLRLPEAAMIRDLRRNAGLDR